MDKRSWLWRRKSSEKSPGGETESTGSVSSYSERFFDDQAYAAHSSQSPEVTSKAALNDEDVNESVKALKDSLSAALLEISTKEDLVKQHSKVAEEAVTGWEKAENEVSVLKKKLEAANQKNSSLEEHLGHLDQALKECVRQLRQAREEQEQKIHVALAKKTREWESSKSVLESQLADLQEQLRSAETDALSVIESDLRAKLEAAEKENSALKLELHLQAEELEIGILERDLSIKASESASRQHLESMKRVAKLESECRRLKAIVRKTSQTNHQKSLSTSSAYVESFTDSQSKIHSSEPNEYDPRQAGSQVSTMATERQFESEKKIETRPTTPSIEINLMDDFLEMERLASLPGLESGSNSLARVHTLPDQCGVGEGNFNAALDAVIQRSVDLEKKLESMEREKVELGMALSACQKRLEDSQSRLLEAETGLRELQKRLSLANESKKDADEQVEATRRDRDLVESQLRVVENEVSALLRKVGLLEGQVQKERSVSADNLVQRKKLEDELLNMKLEAEEQKEAELRRVENTQVNVKFRQEKELSLAAEKFTECQKTIASLGQQLKSLVTLEDLLMDSEKPFEFSNESHRNGPVQNSRSSKFLTTKDSEFSDRVKDYSLPMKNIGDRVSALSLT